MSDIINSNDETTQEIISIPMMQILKDQLAKLPEEKRGTFKELFGPILNNFLLEAMQMSEKSSIRQLDGKELEALIQATFESLIPKLEEEYPNEESLEAFTQNEQKDLKLRHRLSEIFETNFLREAMKITLNEGGMDTLMKGYLNLKTEIGQNRLRELLTEFNQRLERESLEASIAYLDVDHFKSVNEVMGHTVGDLVLNHVARIVHEKMRGRGNDAIFIRDGGEEIAILMLNRSEEQAAEMLEEARIALEKTPLYLRYPYYGNSEEGRKEELSVCRIPDVISEERVKDLGLSYENLRGIDSYEGRNVAERYVVDGTREGEEKIVIRAIKVTASAGVASYSPKKDGESDEECYERNKTLTDKTMQEAKSNGRNQVRRSNGEKFTISTSEEQAGDDSKPLPSPNK